MARDPSDPGPELLAFLTERHLATLTTLRPDGSPHVVPVGVTYDAATRTVTWREGEAARVTRAACGRYLPASASDGASALFGSCPFQVLTHASFGVAPITKSSVPPAFISSYVMYGRCSGVPFRLTDWT